MKKFIFFFFKQKTAYEIYQCDWSSDVCSTDLDRFGIDTRQVAETMWRLTTAARPYIGKFATLKTGNGPSFRSMEWRLYCDSKNRVPLMFAAEIDDAAVGKRAIMM